MGAEQHCAVGRGKQEVEWRENLPAQEQLLLYSQATKIPMNRCSKRLRGHRDSSGRDIPSPGMTPAFCGTGRADVATCGQRGCSPGHEQMCQAATFLGQFGHIASTTAERMPTSWSLCACWAGHTHPTAPKVPILDWGNHCICKELQKTCFSQPHGRTEGKGPLILQHYHPGRQLSLPLG